VLKAHPLTQERLVIVWLQSVFVVIIFVVFWKVFPAIFLPAKPFQFQPISKLYPIDYYYRPISA